MAKYQTLDIEVAKNQIKISKRQNIEAECDREKIQEDKYINKNTKRQNIEPLNIENPKSKGQNIDGTKHQTQTRQDIRSTKYRQGKFLENIDWAKNQMANI